MHDYSSSDESFFPTRLILQTSILQENRFGEEHVKHLSLRNIGMFSSFILTIVNTFASIRHHILIYIYIYLMTLFIRVYFYFIDIDDTSMLSTGEAENMIPVSKRYVT